MPTALSTELRKKLNTTTLKAREIAEKACRAALENLAVHEAAPRPHMKDDPERCALRNRLRARGRSLGDKLEKNSTQSLTFLTQDAAYEHWHRLLFTYFLTKNDLLVTDAENGHVPITLAECEELAPEMDARDGLDLACRFASEVLPGVFRVDDPILQLPIAGNHHVDLRRLVDALPTAVFQSDDALGWTYQFWQEKRKKEVNDSGVKIGAAEISPVTQLFTEDYMVEFMLHNTLGAWWAGKHGPVTAGTEAEARAKFALPPRDGLPAIQWSYLRLTSDDSGKWSPAGSTFTSWPKKMAEVTVLDPSMGSGHFPAFALPLIARLRMEEEGSTAQEAIHATLRENLHGLELDPRCCQIGAFNLALTAWKLQGKFSPLPTLNIACCGLAPRATKDDWVNLGTSEEHPDQPQVLDARLAAGMNDLFDLFSKAPELGSLILPGRELQRDGDLPIENFSNLQPLLSKALATESGGDRGHELAVTAQGLAKAAELLSSQFTLVITNVPYLSRSRQGQIIRAYGDKRFPDSKNELAAMFMERCFSFSSPEGTCAVVSPTNWLLLSRYENLRNRIVSERSFEWLVNLGNGAFRTIGGEVVTVSLVICSPASSKESHDFPAIDSRLIKTVDAKKQSLVELECKRVSQDKLHLHPDTRILIQAPESLDYLFSYADSRYEFRTGDLHRYSFNLWEVHATEKDYEPFQGSGDSTTAFGGLERVLFWEEGQGALRDFADIGIASIQGMDAWGKAGVLVSLMGALASTSYTGEIYDNCVAVIWTEDSANLPAVLTFCSSESFNTEVRMIDDSIKVTNRTLLKIPFDLEHWQKVAAEKYPDGLPKPYSNDPTQWLFKGRIDDTAPENILHVATARLLNYRWPAELDAKKAGVEITDEDRAHWEACAPHSDADGIVCLPTLNKEGAAAARLRALLSVALGDYDERALIQATGSKKTKLEDWLRDDFSKGHCGLFKNRPFIWHLWDGLKDGFHALVNYHQLDHANLKTLIYSYLGDWISDQKSGVENEVPGAVERLTAAEALKLKLEAILEGEAPHDIFVRWKPLSEQPLGWTPDLNDGVRQNIRPFLLAGDVGLKGAGLFRMKPGVALKDKPDRGTEPERPKADYPWFWHEKDPGTDPTGEDKYQGKRWNTTHLTLDYKRKAKS